MKIGKVKKAVPNRKDKNTYGVIIKNPDQELKHVSKSKKVHRAVRFEQIFWMKPYIILNTKLRTAAKNEFEKKKFKLLNNSVFGKTRENIRNNGNIKIVKSQEKYTKYVMKSNLKNEYAFSSELFTIKIGKTEIKMNKLVYLGQAIMETFMYEFYFEYIQTKYRSKVRLCYMDTGSFAYEIETEDVYKDIGKDIGKRLITSRYSKDTTNREK